MTASAVRGPPSRNAISPKISPGTNRLKTASLPRSDGRAYAYRAGAHDVQIGPFVTFAEKQLAAFDLASERMRHKAVDDPGVQAAKKWVRPKQGLLARQIGR